MFGLSPKLPVTDEERGWVDDAFAHFASRLGERRMRKATVILPTPEHFPDPYDGSEESAHLLFGRVCRYMGIDRSNVEFEVYADHADEFRKSIPFWSGKSNDAAGLYFHPDEEGRVTIGISESQLEDPLALVATLAHELGHVVLLGGEVVPRDAADMEPLTDLVTVFLGLGIFTANTAQRMHKWTNDREEGWRMQRLGYLSERVYGYALARFAHVRSEDKPEWAEFLNTNVRSYFKSSLKWLHHRTEGHTRR